MYAIPINGYCPSSVIIKIAFMGVKIEKHSKNTPLTVKLKRILFKRYRKTTNAINLSTKKGDTWSPF